MDMASGTGDATMTPGEPQPTEPPPAGLAGIHFGPGRDGDQDGPAGTDGAGEAGPGEPEDPPR
jgi:hypothetical protein